MADYINNVATGNAYSRDLTLGPAATAKNAVITVANAGVLMQLAQATPGGASHGVFDEREYLVPSQSFRVSNIVGVRFRSAVAGTPARILAILSGPDDPVWESGLPFTGILSASGGIAPATGAVTPSGAVLPFAGGAAPTGFVLCDGASYLRVGNAPDMAALFAAIGVVYGAADGAHFNVPDLRGRIVAGLGTHADVAALANNDGAALANRRPKHFHNIGGDNAAAGGSNSIAGSVGGGVAWTKPTSPSGVPTPLDAPAYIVLQYIIAL